MSSWSGFFEPTMRKHRDFEHASYLEHLIAAAGVTMYFEGVNDSELAIEEAIEEEEESSSRKKVAFDQGLHQRTNFSICQEPKARGS